MRLMDSFYKAFDQTLTWLKKIEAGKKPGYDSVRTDIEKSVFEGAETYIEAGFSKEQYDTAKYAVAAFIDETILASSWDKKQEWHKNLLQASWFNTLNAGEGFFKRLDALNPVNPSEREIREVYYYCLSLGFKGQYNLPGQQSFLNQTIETNLDLLTGSLKRRLKDGGNNIFSVGDISDLKGEKLKSPRQLRVFAIGIPVILFVLLFYFLKMRVIDAANFLITII